MKEDYIMETCYICNREKENNEFIKFGICLDCYYKYPANFDKLEKHKRFFIHKCENNHLYFSKGSNDKNCPICYSIIPKCTNCGKELVNRRISQKEIDNNKRYFCSSRCQYIFIVKQNKSSGNCSICGIFNQVRDQNARGISDCNCSTEWHIKFANSDLNKGKENIKIWNNSEKGKEHNIKLNKNKKEIYSKAGKCTNPDCRKDCKENERSITGLCPKCQRKISQKSISIWNNSKQGKKFKREFFQEKANKYKQS